jgi:hypothetical protein
MITAGLYAVSQSVKEVIHKRPRAERKRGHQIPVRGFLECRSDDGRNGVFYRSDKILLSPELQERCLEQDVLRRIMDLIEMDPTVAKQLRQQMRTDDE